MQHLEEMIAHLTRSVDDLSDVVARQEGDIARLTKQVRVLLDRESARDTAGDGQVILGDDKPPPHY